MASTPVGSNALIQEVLDRSNYKKWRLRLKTYLLSEDLWDVVEANTEPPKLEDDQAGYKAWTKKNAKALYAIQSSCGPEMFPFISETESAEAAWEALEQECKVLLGYDENNADHLVRYKSFIGYVRRGDWDRAMKCLGEVDVRSVVVRAIARWDGMTALHVAAWEGHAHIVKELVHLMTQEDCKTKTGSGRTALHLAAQQGHVHVVKELPVQLMGEVQDKGGDTALHNAVHSGKVDVVKELVLLMRREDLQIKNHAGYTALHLAVNKGNMPMVKEFVTKEKGENNIGMDDFERYIPFTTYVKNGDWDKANECLRELDDPCSAVTAVDPRDNYRDTALHVAAREGHLDVIRGLILLLKMRREDLELKTAQDVTAYGSGITLGVTEEFLMDRAKYMVEQYKKTHGIFLEMKYSEGCTALYLAVRLGNVDIVKELAHMMTQEGLELKSFSGSSALHQAVGYERIDIVLVLVPLMRKEGLEIKDDHGDTPLNCAVFKGNVDIVKVLVQSMRQEGLEIRNSKAEIALPRAISKGHMHIVRELLPLMRPEAFEEKDGRGFTALCRAIACLKDGEVYEIAKYMAERNDRVFGIPSAPYDEIPVVQALRWRKWRLARSIYSLTPLELIDQPNGGAFICYCLDTSTQIGIHIQEIIQVNIHDVSINVEPSEDGHEKRKVIISSGITLFRRFVEGLHELFGIHSIYEMKSTHRWIFEILQCMVVATRNDDLSQDQLDTIKISIFKAIQQGHFEFVTHICKANPELLGRLIEDKEVKGIFHFAIEFRQNEVYSLIYGLGEKERRELGIYLVNNDYTLLHCASNLPSLPQFSHIQDAGLQMQREIQWFKEVESVVPPEMYERRDRSNDMTARELFTMNHKKLLEDAEISIKGTATSCTVVGALIVTMMFAAAFTVPGGNDGNIGLPLFLNHKLFKVYMVSDTISLVSSTSSVITFLGILTSRYAENDFLRSLPTKIMIGLITLFSSIVSMVIAFSCALILMFDGEAWIVMLSILFTSVPVILFVWLLFPLLIKTFMSTYGPGIIDKKRIKRVKS